MELLHKTHVSKGFSILNLSTMIQSHCALSFLHLDFFAWKQWIIQIIKQNEIQPCFCPIISNVDDQTYNCKKETIATWTTNFNSRGSPFSPPSQQQRQQQPTGIAATSAAPNLLNDFFTGKNTVAITSICV